MCGHNAMAGQWTNSVKVQFILSKHASSKSGWKFSNAFKHFWSHSFFPLHPGWYCKDKICFFTGFEQQLDLFRRLLGWLGFVEQLQHFLWRRGENFSLSISMNIIWILSCFRSKADQGLAMWPKMVEVHRCVRAQPRRDKLATSTSAVRLLTYF